MGWIKYAAITACALAAADLCVKLAASRISSSLLMLIYGCCTLSTGLGWVLWQWARGIPQHAQLSGVLASIGMGFAFSGVTLGLYVTFSAGSANLSRLTCYPVRRDITDEYCWLNPVAGAAHLAICHRRTARV